MKSIIDGFRYDTEAKFTTLIASYSIGKLTSQTHIRETLYRTGHGNWFLVCAGGSLSRHSKRAPNGEWYPHKRILPMSSEQAQWWLQKRRKTAALKKHFPT